MTELSSPSPSCGGSWRTRCSTPGRRRGRRGGGAAASSKQRRRRRKLDRRSGGRGDATARRCASLPSQGRARRYRTRRLGTGFPSGALPESWPQSKLAGGRDAAGVRLRADGRRADGSAAASPPSRAPTPGGAGQTERRPPRCPATARLSEERPRGRSGAQGLRGGGWRRRSLAGAARGRRRAPPASSSTTKSSWWGPAAAARPAPLSAPPRPPRGVGRRLGREVTAPLLLAPVADCGVELRGTGGRPLDGADGRQQGGPAPAGGPVSAKLVGDPRPGVGGAP